MISWARPSNRSDSCFRPVLVSKVYSFSILTRGILRRSPFISSRSPISSCSLRSKSLRTINQSSRDTTGFSMIISPFLPGSVKYLATREPPSQLQSSAAETHVALRPFGRQHRHPTHPCLQGRGGAFPNTLPATLSRHQHPDR